LHAVIAKSFARIHWQNLTNFGILALEFTTEEWIAPHQGQLISPPSRAGTARLATAHHTNMSLTQRMSGSASRSSLKEWGRSRAFRGFADLSFGLFRQVLGAPN